MKSRVYKYNNKLFRYDYDESVLEWVCKPTKEMLKDNEDWVSRFGHPLWTIDDGYNVIQTIGLSRESFETDRESYFAMWSDDLDEESAYLLAHYKRFG